MKRAIAEVVGWICLIFMLAVIFAALVIFCGGCTSPRPSPHSPKTHLTPSPSPQGGEGNPSGEGHLTVGPKGRESQSLLTPSPTIEHGSAGTPQSYAVYYGGQSRTYTNLAQAGATNRVSIALSPGDYFFAAVAEQDGVESDYSNEASAHLAKSTTVTLAWNEPRIDIGISLEGTTNWSEWAPVAVLPVQSIYSPTGNMFFRSVLTITNFPAP